MKVLLLNGSAKPNGNTAQALEAAAAVLRADGIETWAATPSGTASAAASAPKRAVTSTMTG